MKPSIIFRALRPAVAADFPTDLDLIITVKGPDHSSATQIDRPPLNLALVIDKSASMHGRGISYARKAARQLVRLLGPTDRLAIITFNSEAQVLVPSTRVVDRSAFIDAINGIEPSGQTALCSGWLSAADQVCDHLDPTAINRVILLTDGEANVGTTDPTEIGAKISSLVEHEISTSAFGLGTEFNEDLLSVVAAAGNGSFASIGSPSQLTGVYAKEFLQLAQTYGERVSIGIRPKNGAELIATFNDLPRTSAGNFKIPNILYGEDFSIGLRLRLPAWEPNQEIASVRLAWDSPKSSMRQELTAHLLLPVLSIGELFDLPVDCAVQEKLALFHANNERRQIISAIDGSDFMAAANKLSSLQALFRELPQTTNVRRELRLLGPTRELLVSDPNLTRKRLRSESLRSTLNVLEVSDEQS